MKAEEKFPILTDEAKRWHETLKAMPQAFERGSLDQLTELRELLEFWDAHQWQPIETAPKDGSEIELWNGSVRTARWGDRIVGKINLPCFISRGITVASSTHWRPLPKGPQ